MDEHWRYRVTAWAQLGMGYNSCWECTTNNQTSLVLLCNIQYIDLYRDVFIESETLHCKKKGSQPVCCFECSSKLMSSPILSVFLCNSWYYVQTPICPAVTRYFTKTFAKLGYNHHHHRLISGKDWKQSVGVCWKRTQHAEKEVSVSLCGMSVI